MKIHKLYKINIYERYKELKNAGKTNDTIDNYDLSKIFEWYSCIYLYQQYDKPFYEYSDIEPTFKEINNMTKNDTGIDCCDLVDTIVQCKLRKDTLDWKECGTFFGSQNIYSEELNKIIVRWNNLIITRNEECKLSKNLLEKSKLFTDISFPRQNIIDYCEALLSKPPKYPKQEKHEFDLRDYQVEAINLIRKNNKNTIISLPTGCGKNVVIIYSMKKNKKYLILVPRIILMEQIHDEIIRHKPELKNTIQCIGDTNNDYNESKNICICVYNSVSLIEPYFESFTKIYIDEAHHIDKPMIYDNDNNINDDNIEEDLNEDILDLDDDIEDEQDIELIDDEEDEIKETTGYHNIIKTLSKYNNNVYLSATIDEIKDFTYYKKDIRDMIEMKYLCDYNIHIPIFSNDITNMNICEHLIKNYRNIIIYCNSQKEGNNINTLMNTLQKGCSEYIDCMTTKTKRNNIIKKYKEGLIPFLVNVRILVEGFDAPITKGICFMHLPSNKTTLIQIIGRALRLHPLKTIAHIILPFSTKEDESNINNFLKVMANNDKRIKQSYENKKIGGYISIENTIEDFEEGNTDFEFRYNMIFDNMGKLLNGEEIWMKRLEETKQYIDKSDKIPSSGSNDNFEKSLGIWCSNQRVKYKDKTLGNWKIKKLEEINGWYWNVNYKFLKKLETLKKWINTNNKFPTHGNKNDNTEYLLGKWCTWLRNEYKINKLDKSKIEQLENINGWYWSKNDFWYINLNKLKIYLNENKCLPSKDNTNNDIYTLYLWYITNKNKYEKNLFIMKDIKIKKEWELFIEQYKKYIVHNLTFDEKWLDMFKKLKEYINKNKKRPYCKDIDVDVRKLGEWTSHQIENHKNKEHIMKKEYIYNLWNNFINEYKEYLLSDMEIWNLKLDGVKNFLDNNHKKPSAGDKDSDVKKLGQFISLQKTNYIKQKGVISEPKIREIWEEFINNHKYKKYFTVDKKTN
jgi:superfamily II DNA or RNA helicase